MSADCFDSAPRLHAGPAVRGLYIVNIRIADNLMIIQNGPNQLNDPGKREFAGQKRLNRNLIGGVQDSAPSRSRRPGLPC